MLKRYVYTTDKGRRYLVKLDAALGALGKFGFERPSVTDGELDPLPRGMKMRSIGCLLIVADTNDKRAKYRVFAVASKTASILAFRGRFSYKGCLFH